MKEEATSLGSRQVGKCTSLFKLRPNCTLSSLSVPVSTRSAAAHCPLNAQAATQLLCEVQQTVPVDTRACISTQTLSTILFYYYMSTLLFITLSSQGVHHQSHVQKTLYIPWALQLLEHTSCTNHWEQLHFVLWLQSLKLTGEDSSKGGHWHCRWQGILPWYDTGSPQSRYIKKRKR